MESSKGDVHITDNLSGTVASAGGSAVSPFVGVNFLDSDASWLSLLHVDRLEELFSASCVGLPSELFNSTGYERPPSPKPPALLKSRTLDILQRWLESCYTDTPAMVNSPNSSPVSTNVSPLFSDLGSPQSSDDSTIFPATWFSTAGSDASGSVACHGGTSSFRRLSSMEIRSPTRRTMEIGCQTDITMSDFDGKHHPSPAPLLPPPFSRPSSPAVTSMRSTPETCISEDDGDGSGPDFESCKSPEEVLALILRCRQNRSDHLYHCPSCDRAFSRRFNLKTHYAGTHCNVRNFSCSSCDRAFSRRYDLQRHEKLVHKLDSVPASPSGGRARRRAL